MLLRIVSKENNEIISFVVELVLIFFVKVISFSKVDTVLHLLKKQEIDYAKKTSEGGRSQDSFLVPLSTGCSIPMYIIHHILVS